MMFSFRLRLAAAAATIALASAALAEDAAPERPSDASRLAVDRKSVV